MLSSILERPHNRDISFIETTITADNIASRALFAKLATALNAKSAETLAFDKSIHFDNEHNTEFLIRIGPISPNQNQ